MREKITNLLQKSKKLLSSFKCSFSWSLRELLVSPQQALLAFLHRVLHGITAVIKTTVSRVCLMTQESRISGSIYVSWTEHFYGICSIRVFLQLWPYLPLWTPLNSFKTVFTFASVYVICPICMYDIVWHTYQIYHNFNIM